MVDASSTWLREAYEQFVLRRAANSIGKRVKLADLQENSALARMPDAKEPDNKHMRQTSAQSRVSSQVDQRNNDQSRFREIRHKRRAAGCGLKRRGGHFEAGSRCWQHHRD